jgi:hypothetical protein
VSTVRVKRYVACPFSATIEFAETALRRMKNLHVSPIEGLGERVISSAKIVDDSTDKSRRHDALLITWRPEHRLFPDFKGTLTIRPRTRGTSVRLQGSYDPPFGVWGRAFDLVFGRAIAHRTLARLLAQLGADVEGQWDEFRRTHSRRVLHELG